MFSQTLAPKTERLIKALAETIITDNFYLAGGTGLALQFGHRQSLDLDFFSASKFSVNDLKIKLSRHFSPRVIAEDQDTLHVIIGNIKVSWLYYPYPLLANRVVYQGIKIADWQDIAAMKLSAASNRGSKKDFIDLYLILKRISLAKLLRLFNKKYRKIKCNQAHLLKSLVYFTDAEKETMPKMIIKANWREIKKNIQRQVINYLAKK